VASKERERRISQQLLRASPFGEGCCQAKEIYHSILIFAYYLYSWKVLSEFRCKRWMFLNYFITLAGINQRVPEEAEEN